MRNSIINLDNLEERYCFPPYTSTYRALVQPELADPEIAHRENMDMLGICEGLFEKVGALLDKYLTKER